MKDNLDGVRLDTPGSRKGDFAELISEVRWELDVRGFENVDIIASGGLDEESLPPLIEAGADGFGIGTSITNAPVLNLAMDIVELEGEPAAKRGKFGGRKKVWKCKKCLETVVSLADKDKPHCPECGGETESSLELIVENGEIVRDLPTPDEIRDRVLKQLENFELE